MQAILAQYQSQDQLSHLRGYQEMTVVLELLRVLIQEISSGKTS